MLRPEVATAPLIATPAMTGWPYVSGIVPAGRARWFIAEVPTGTAPAPAATATVYRWSGSAWLRQGTVDQVPASLNYYALTGAGLSVARFEAVTVPGAAGPAFLLANSRRSHPDVLTDPGGHWHAARD